MKTRINIWECMYAFLWRLLLLGVAYPSILSNYDFSFSDTFDNRTISSAYMFFAVIAVYLLDIVYATSSDGIIYNKMKKRFIHALASIRLKEYIRTKYNGCVKKYKQNNSDTENLVFTFSSTFDEGKNEVSYSCFPIKFSKGIIPYVLKNEEVRRKRKY